MTFFRRREQHSAQCRRSTKTGVRCTHKTTDKNRDCGRHGPRAPKPPEPPPPPEPPKLPRRTRSVSTANGLGLAVVAAIAGVACFVLWWFGLIFLALFLLALFLLMCLFCVVQHRRTGFKRETDDQEATPYS